MISTACLPRCLQISGVGLYYSNMLWKVVVDNLGYNDLGWHQYASGKGLLTAQTQQLMTGVV